MSHPRRKNRSFRGAWSSTANLHASLIAPALGEHRNDTSLSAMRVDLGNNAKGEAFGAPFQNACRREHSFLGAA
ncbi:hypothetical protein V8C35DRAFT_303605 [Trichoderma chlorosporum]